MIKLKNIAFIKTLALTLCLALVASTKVYPTKIYGEKDLKWRVALSNAYFAERFDNLQLEFDRRFARTSLGLYVQGLNYVVNYRFNSIEADYLPKGGFTANGMSLQAGLQIASHLLFPKASDWDFWFKWRVGASLSNNINTAGTYWFWGDQDLEKEYYTIAERQSHWFSNLEAGFGMGLSRRIYDNLFGFVEPAFNFQFLTENHLTRLEDFQVNGFLQLRWGFSFAF